MSEHDMITNRYASKGWTDEEWKQGWKDHAAAPTPAPERIYTQWNADQDRLFDQVQDWGDVDAALDNAAFILKSQTWLPLREHKKVTLDPADVIALAKLLLEHGHINTCQENRFTFGHDTNPFGNSTGDHSN